MTVTAELAHQTVRRLTDHGAPFDVTERDIVSGRTCSAIELEEWR